MTEPEKDFYMALALAESRRALPACRPNPPVGCVLVKNHTVIARGHTQPPGHDHAEAMALRQYTESLDDVAVFVTLEPCSFSGRTPSCALALIARRPQAVFVAALDPHPRNRGAGIDLLREAGIAVEVGVLAESVMQFIGPHLAEH